MMKCENPFMKLIYSFENVPRPFFFPFRIVGYRFVFDSADECTVVHNALYSCLRAIFGISVAGVLVAVFSCKSLMNT